MMETESRDDRKSKDLVFYPKNEPTSMTDRVNIAKRNNGSLFLQFVSISPDAVIENHRTFIENENVNDFIDSLCKICDHFPKKSAGSKK